MMAPDKERSAETPKQQRGRRGGHTPRRYPATMGSSIQTAIEGESSIDLENIDDEELGRLYRTVQQQQREIDRLRDKVEEDTDRDKQGRGGTPNLSGDVRAKLNEGPPREAELESVPEKTLHRALSEGPEAFTSGKNPIYPVHERAYKVLIHAPSLARSESEDGSTLFLTAPTVKRFLESQEDTRLKHTQIRRVFETIEEAGKEYPRTPTLHKNRDGVIELVIYDYPSLFNQSLLS